MNSDEFGELWESAQGPDLDMGDIVNSLVWENLRSFHNAGTAAGFTDEQVWKVTEQVMLAAILPNIFAHGTSDGGEGE